MSDQTGQASAPSVRLGEVVSSADLRQKKLGEDDGSYMCRTAMQ